MERIFSRILAVFMVAWAVSLPAQTLVELGGVNNDGGAFVNFGIADSSNNEKIAMPLSLSSPAAISKIVVELTKVGSPTDNAVIEARQGSPDGVLLAGGSVGGSAVSASGSRHEITVPAFTVAQNVYVVYARSGPSDPRNFYKAVRGTSGSGFGIVTSGGFMYLRTGVGWGSSNLQNSPKISLFGTLVSLGQVAISPGSSISFGDTTVGLTISRQFRIRNTGTAVLTLSSVSSNSASFNVVPAIVPNTNINVGDSLAVTVNFLPTSTGAVSGVITVTHDGVNGPTTTVAVNGNGVAVSSGGSGGSGSSGSTPPPASPPVPGITLTPASLAMAATLGGTDQRTVEIRNDSSAILQISSISVSGPSAINFRVSSGSETIESGGRRLIVVSYTPTSVRTDSVAIRLVHNADGGVSLIPIRGVGTASSAPGGPVIGPVVSLSESAIGFDSLGTGSVTSRTITIRNIGDSFLYVSRVVISGANYSEFAVGSANEGEMVINPDSTRILQILFKPLVSGPKSAAAVIVNNSVSNPAVVVPLSGSSPIRYAVPTVRISANVLSGPAPLEVRLANTNTGGRIDLWEWQPGDYAELPGIRAKVIITKRRGDNENGDTLIHIFTRPGIYRPQLNVRGPGGEDTQILADSIMVLAPQLPVAILQVDRDSLNMNAIDVGASIQSSLRISNSGTGPLNGRVTLDGDSSFGIVSADSFSIPVGAEDRTIAVRFSPQSDGLKSGRLIIAYNADPGIRYIVLSGEGRLPQAVILPEPVTPRPQLDISAVSINLGNIIANRDTSYYRIPVGNSGTADLKIWLILDDPSRNFFLLASRPDSILLAPGGRDSVLVAFGPNTAGSKTARLHLFHTAEPGRYAVNLTGEAEQFTATVDMADFDGSGSVNLGDFFLLAEQIGRTDYSPEEIRRFDLNGDRQVNSDDFFVFADFFGREVVR